MSERLKRKRVNYWSVGHALNMPHQILTPTSVAEIPAGFVIATDTRNPPRIKGMYAMTGGAFGRWAIVQVEGAARPSRVCLHEEDAERICAHFDEIDKKVLINEAEAATRAAEAAAVADTDKRPSHGRLFSEQAIEEKVKHGLSLEFLMLVYLMKAVREISTAMGVEPPPVSAELAVIEEKLCDLQSLPN